jgi:hypothetical protein
MNSSHSAKGAIHRVAQTGGNLACSLCRGNGRIPLKLWHNDILGHIAMAIELIDNLRQRD